MSSKSVEELQKSLHSELDEFRACQKEYQKAIAKRQQLDAQLNENTAVETELKMVECGEDVYKLIGPVLVKQDLGDALQNVRKRMEYILDELKRLDASISKIDKKQDTHRETLTTLQRNLEQATIKGGERKLVAARH